MGGEEQFTWTTHPWLITQPFGNLTGNVTATQIADMETAIDEGLIQWHAAPMNLQVQDTSPAGLGFRCFRTVLCVGLAVAIGCAWGWLLQWLDHGCLGRSLLLKAIDQNWPRHGV